MGVNCSCFGKSQSDHGEGEGLEDGVKKRFLQKVFKKKGQAESAASNVGSRVAAAEPLQTNTNTAPRAISMLRVAHPTRQPNPQVNSQNSSHYESQHNKPGTAEAVNSVTSQRKRNDRKKRRSKPLAKETTEAKAKHLVASSEEESKNCVENLPSSDDDEDVCPTCLEEFDEENPKITSECNHHFHLACIFEWMERSPSCPVCNKAMVFEPMT